MGSTKTTPLVMSFMQKLDLGYSNRENFKNYYLTIITKATLLALIFLFSSLITTSMTSFMTDNKDSFNYLLYYVGVDSKLRGIIQLINNESYSILMLGIYNYYLATDPTNSLLPTIRRECIEITQSLRRVLNMRDLVPFIYDRVDAAISTFFKAYETSASDLEENILDKQTLLNMMRVRNDIIGPAGEDRILTFIKDIEFDGFIKRYMVESYEITEFLQDLRKYTDGQEPPFAINDPPLLRRFTDLVDAMINLVHIGNAGVLPRHAKAIFEASTLMKETSVDELKQFVLWMSIAFFSVVGLFIAYICSIIWIVRRKLFSYLSLFESFKSEEVILHSMISNVHHKAFTTNKFREELIIGEYMQCGKADTKGIILSQRHNEEGVIKSARIKSDERRPIKQSQAQRSTGSRKHVRISQDKLFSAPLWEGILGTITFIFLTALYISNSVIETEIYSSMRTEDIFFDYYEISARMKEYALNTNLMLIYGNYIKVDGQYVEDIPDSTPIAEAASFWIGLRSRLGDYFNESDSDTVDKLLTGELCSKIHSDDPEELATLKFLCKDYTPAQKGMFAVWNAAQDLNSANRLTVRSTQKQWLQETRTDYAEFSPNVDLIFSDNNIRTRYLYNSLLELFIDQLFSIMDSTLARKFASIGSSLNIVTWIGACGQIILIICAFTITFKLLRVNTEICRETYANILPETIFQNQHIHQAFKNHFVKNK